MSEAGQREVTRLLQSPEPSDAQITDVIMAVSQAGGLEYARERAIDLAQRAEGELELLPASSAREALRDSITYVVDRRS
jgi:geranylgeranyl pyrophosphate synthase